MVRLYGELPYTTLVVATNGKGKQLVRRWYAVQDVYTFQWEDIE